MKSARVRWFQVVLFSILVAAASGCGPSNAGDDDDDDGETDVDAANPNCSNPLPEACGNDQDDDCDGYSDCDDSDCSASCGNANCGILETPTASLSLPDGDCDKDESIPCAGYESDLLFTGFSQGQTLTDISKLLGVCVNMEHSWMRDLVIYAECPNGTRVMLSDFQGHNGGAVNLGVPNQSDGGPPGTGWDYCWTPTATNLPWIPYADANLPSTLPAGDYQSSQPLTQFLGCPLNGAWTIRVEDRWGFDDGFIFNWSVKFDAGIVEDCENWPG